MNSKRRVFLKGTLAASAVGVAVGAGMLAPRSVLAAWPEAAFQARSLSDALSAAMGSSSLTEGNVSIQAPDIAENGAVVPITIESGISGAESVALLVTEANHPLTSSYVLGAGAKANISTRIKMGSTSDVVAVVKANGRLYSASKEVKVTIGGCGG
jgi:sulfur-oxidizing protein SoxY